MKRLFFLAILANSVIALSQEPILWTYGNTEITFEDTSDYKFVLIDTNGVWQIAEPKKGLLQLSTFKAIIADTNLYYKNNLRASFQFRLILGPADAYSINFNHKYDFEQNRDGGIIETSYDNGTTWQNIILDTLIHSAVPIGIEGFYRLTDTIVSYDNHPGFTGLQSDIASPYYIFNADYSIHGDTMLLRFTIASDAVDSTNEGWVLDNFIFGGHMMDNMNDLKQKPNIKIYPNPAHNILTINSEKERITSFEIISLTGQLLTSKFDNNITSVDISKLQTGLYFFVCKSVNNQSWISKINKL
jgi:hypothetical protein